MGAQVVLGCEWGHSGPHWGQMPPCPPLQRGDEVRCEIEELGTICNRVV